MKFIIDLADNLTSEEVDALVASSGWTVLKKFEQLGNIILVESAQEIAVGGNIESVVRDDSQPIQLLSQYDLTQPAENLTFSTSAQNDWWKSYTFNDIDHQQATIDVPRFGGNAIIYVVDSGIKSDHAEFTGRTITNLFSFNGDFTDTNGHGTALASVMVGNQCGITDAHVKSVKIFQSGVPTYQSDMLAAFDAIIADASQNAGKLMVANLSWNIARNSYIESKIAILIAQGVRVVAASGNDGSEITDVTPAAMASVMTIGAYSEDFLPCDFTNYTSSAVSITQGATNGGALDGWAPGINIRAATLDGNLAMVAGTSIAAAIHTAVLAYNSTVCTYENGNLGYMMDDASSISLATAMALSRNGLLTLDGVYASSVNKVSTAFSQQSDYVAMDGSQATFIVGIRNSVPVIRAVNVQSVSFDQDLPAGLTFDNGFVHGSLLAVPGGKEYDYVPYVATINFTDGTSRNQVLNLGLVSDTFDLGAAQPGTDPVLDIILALPVCCGLTSGATGCMAATDCFSCWRPSDGMGGKLSQCYCNDVNSSCQHEP